MRTWSVFFCLWSRCWGMYPKMTGQKAVAVISLLTFSIHRAKWRCVCRPWGTVPLGPLHRQGYSVQDDGNRRWGLLRRLYRPVSPHSGWLPAYALPLHAAFLLTNVLPSWPLPHVLYVVLRLQTAATNWWNALEGLWWQWSAGLQTHAYMLGLVCGSHL